MLYSVGEIRRNILKLKDGSQGFFFDIPLRGRVEFYRIGAIIYIVNPNNKDGVTAHIERDCLYRGRTEIERDMLFGVFLENILKSGLDKIGV